jgi:hypothetical protein
LEVAGGALHLEGCAVIGRGLTTRGLVCQRGARLEARHTLVSALAMTGVLVEGTALLEECDLTLSSEPVLLLDEGDLTARRCRFRKGRDNGVRQARGRSLFEACEFSDNARLGFAVSDGGTALLRSCTSHGHEHGLSAFRGGILVAEACVVERNDVGLYVYEGAKATLRGCSLRGNRIPALARAKATAILEGCALGGKKATSESGGSVKIRAGPK